MKNGRKAKTAEKCEQITVAMRMREDDSMEKAIKKSTSE